jgi:hypothetical protein
MLCYRDNRVIKLSFNGSIGKRMKADSINQTNRSPLLVWIYRLTASALLAICVSSAFHAPVVGVKAYGFNLPTRLIPVALLFLLVSWIRKPIIRLIMGLYVILAMSIPCFTWWILMRVTAYDITWLSLLLFPIPVLFATDIAFRSDKVRDYYAGSYGQSTRSRTPRVSP